MFGDDMERAVLWLTDDQAQQEARQQRRMHRSPSWDAAEDLAAIVGAFSVAACRCALETSTRPVLGL